MSTEAQDIEEEIEDQEIPGTYYELISPDGFAADVERYKSLEELVKGAVAFVDRYRHQGYYKDMRMQKIPVADLLEFCQVAVTVVPDPSRMTPEACYVKYIQDNLERIGADWQPICYEEFLESEEMQNILEKARLKTEWRRIGHVGVDSGQLMVCDPCYLSNWVDDHPSGEEGNLGYKHEDGTILFCELHGPCKAEGAIGFFNFEQVIEKYGKTANQLQKEGKIKKVKRIPSGKFSYSGACQATGSKDQAGELDRGRGVAFSSGFGDGHYPVYARFQDCGDWGRRVAEVKIVMIPEDEECDDE